VRKYFFVKITGLLALLLLLRLTTYAQPGAFLLLEQQRIGLEPLGKYTPDEWNTLLKSPGLGAGAGFCLQKKLLRNWHFRPAIGLSTLRNTLYWPDAPAEVYRFTDLELPLHLLYFQEHTRYKAQGIVIAGIRTSYNFSRSESANLRFRQGRIGADLGLGIALPFKEKWRLHIEVLYSHGLNDIHDFQFLNYDEKVGRGVRDRLGIRFVFYALNRH